jgi:hypothetical protein
MTPSTDKTISWHRLFGLALIDFFTGTRYKVELERDLSLKKQLLDVIIIEQEEGAAPDDVPDGLDNLGPHNLVTYKSLHEPLDSLVLGELIGHFINYRKQISLSWDNLTPVEDFRLYAVCTREPEKLRIETSVEVIKEGVYQVQWGIFYIRVIVLSTIPESPRNTLWQMFSAVRDKAGYGLMNYPWRTRDVSSVFNQLYKKYKQEGFDMPYTIEDYKKDELEFFKAEILPTLPVEDRLKGLSPEDRLKGLGPEDRLKGLRPEDRLKGLRPEDRLKGLRPEDRLKGLRPEDRLKGLSLEEIEIYLNQIRKKKGTEKDQ